MRLATLAKRSLVFVVVSSQVETDCETGPGWSVLSYTSILGGASRSVVHLLPSYPARGWRYPACV